ncbi:hypothetical protein NAEGRDRAFT_56920 [Naegleria gruberi]|uniref:Uncharacterized protein n=1 Tax=Naegleria gruberi TaxID=5762 RepID=D2V2I0_NAEGR|nr:uncharacterized protein NAEGRDRAFT_56920 [Naegleria gruberi]EFC48902.1 hypothetical protein NAEGRDRAFT_56920 [Naegleria gruberi]|eukprot:XP_002681646.1 hypothetical protein NAEGRDRAFT_56920 [Naegleria gruberi strain NEG-M]
MVERFRNKKKHTTKSVDTVGKLRKLKKHYPELTGPFKPTAGFTKQPEVVQSNISNEEELRLQRVLAENPLSYDARTKLKRETSKREFRDDLSRLTKQDEAKFQLSFTPKAIESEVKAKEEKYANTSCEKADKNNQQRDMFRVKKHEKKPVTFSTGNVKKRLIGQVEGDPLIGFWQGTDLTKRRKPSEPQQDIVEQVKNAVYNPTTGQSYNPTLKEYKKALEMASKGESKIFNRLDNILDQLTNRDDDAANISIKSIRMEDFLAKTPIENNEEPTEENNETKEKQKPKFLKKKKILSLTKRKGLRKHKGDLIRSLVKKKRAAEETVNVTKLGKKLLRHRMDYEKSIPKIQERRLKEHLKKIRKVPVQRSDDVMINDDKDIEEAFHTQPKDESQTLSSVSSFRTMQSGNSLSLWSSMTRRFHDTKTVHIQPYSKGHMKVGNYTI